MISCYFLNYGGNRFWLAPWDMVIVSFMSPAQNCMRSICTQKNKTPLCATCAPRSHPRLPQYKFILSPIYMHNGNATDRMNKPNTVIFTIKNILLCWTDGGQSRSCLLHVSLPIMLFIHSQASDTTDSHWPQCWSSPSRSFEDAALEASTLCHNLTGWTSSMPMALFRGFLYAYHWCQVLPACRWHQSDPVRNSHSLKG